MIALLSTLLCGVAAAYTTATAPAFVVGVDVHIVRYGPEGAHTLQQLQQLGATSFREGLPWQRIEKKKGVYAIPKNYLSLDKAFLNAHKYGISPLLILDYGNKLYEHGGLVTTKSARDGFVNYVRWVVHRYKGDVKYYEIWNEWNIGFGSTSRPRSIGSVADYAKLVERVYKTIKALDPNAVVLAGGATNFDTEWFRRFVKSGAVRYVDGLSIHPYNYGGSLNKSTPEAAINWVTEIHTMVKDLTGRNMPMYVTEVGWPGHTKGYDPQVVAAYLSRFMILARAKPFIHGVWWYDLRDDGTNPHAKEDRFGLLSHNWQTKPVAKAFESVAPLLTTYKVSSVQQEGKVFLVTMKNPGKRTAHIAWKATAVKRGHTPLSHYEQRSAGASTGISQSNGLISQESEKDKLNSAATESPVPVISYTQ